MESARLGLPGDRENVVKLNADHSGVCKFGDGQIDRDNFKKVQNNIQDLYENALKLRELNATPFVVDQDGYTMDEGSLEERFAQLPPLGGHT
jgi:hypothetical protein